MSEETQIQQQESEKPSQSYISRVRLKGYKSILDTEVTFKPGLNIIIGANGSGKTNFVEFLKFLLENKFRELDADNAEIYFSYQNSSNYYSIERKRIKSEKSQRLINSTKEKLTISGKEEINDDIHPTDHNIEFYDEWNALFPVLISFYISEIFKNLQSLVKFTIKEIQFEDIVNGSIIIERFFVSETEPASTEGLRKLLENIFLDPVKKGGEIKKETHYSIPYNFKNRLKIFTPIQDIQFSPNYEIIIREKEELEVQYLRFEFLVNNNWLTWNQLSDGTKRMFYIVTEITFGNNVILLEEPELGIHPHQLSKLMDFLKEQSEEKQIILTTHSPQVLNILDTDELDRIIVAHYDKEKGTQLHHLEEEEVGHARSYMETEGLFLSDYWVYSGFEKEEEQV